MASNLFFEYSKMLIQFLNEKLADTHVSIQTRLSLKTDSLPEFFNTPVTFSIMLILFSFIVVSYANSIICHCIGILYPVLYCFNIFHGVPVDTNKLTVLNKYWIVYSVLTLLDSFFGFVLHWLPGFFYMKVAIIYLLIRNDFAFSNDAFFVLETLYMSSNFMDIFQKVNIGSVSAASLLGQRDFVNVTSDTPCFVGNLDN